MKQLLPLCALLALVLAAPAQTADEKKATVAYLQALQTKEGGFRPTPKAAAPSLRATSSSLRALRYFGGKAPDVEAARKFVLSCHDHRTGGFADTPGGKPDVIVTAVGLMALVELKVPTEKYENKAIAFMTDTAKAFEQVRMTAAGLEAVGKKSEKNEEWIRVLRAKQNRDGTFGKGKGLVRETGSAVACLLRLGGTVKDKDAVVAALDAGQRGDGGFGREGETGSDLETSYRVTRTYVMLGARPKKADALAAFVGKCRNADGGYGVTPGAPSSVGGAYFAGIILHWLGGK
jgi:prenyltransferase beta subunit